MNDILDDYIKKIHTLQIQERINNYYDNFIINKNKILKLFAVKFEIIRIKLELKKNYINLGKFVSRNYNKEEVVDFSYKDDFFSLNHVQT